ncbi:MAG: carbamoyltransferase HypF [Armatimonadetes bacterium]|nr:carbamoyltransferase HypF [Candidatus Hippobium faecium]
MLCSYDIKIYGIVQAVGFRPMVYFYAVKNNIRGFVRNMGSFVFVHGEGTEENLNKFTEDIKNNPPKNASITEFYTEKTEFLGYTDFQIRESKDEKGNIFISPDLAVCNNCRNEFSDINNPRYEYPFINCTDCGPRFSIINDVPYDRKNTAMAEFDMCESCADEYNNPLDRRYHAEPTCCPVCGPKLFFHGKWEKLNRENPAETACNYLDRGKIIAIKGIGGYHLACNAKDHEAVRKLRQRKHRYEKPFAIMTKDLATAEKYASVSLAEKNILVSRESPIVLLEKRENTDNILSSSVAPNTDKIGIMVPYAPIHYLLFRYLETDALVMTSGNISDEPIVYKEEDAFERLADICDGFLFHNREIENRIDDSVVSCFENKIYPIRRARGYVPKSFSYIRGAKPQILACGALLKNTFALCKDGNVYVSGHIGDLEEGTAFEYYLNQINLYEKIFSIKPDIVISDSHPDYINSKWAETLNIPVIKVFHHKAHAVSAMAQNNLSEAICVTYDGTGYGEDGTVWGGEIFAGSINNPERMGHLKPVAVSGVNTYLSEKISPFKCLVPYLDEDDEFLKLNNLESEYKLIKSVRKLSSFETTSMGRFFDAVSCLVLNKKDISFEGEAPIMLESIAKGEYTDIYDYNIENNVVDQYEIMKQIKTDIKNNISQSEISVKFHNTVASFTAEICENISRETGLKNVTLSGGVFQNMVLLEKVTEKIRNFGLAPYVCRIYPANDGGISFGQAVMALEKEN